MSTSDRESETEDLDDPFLDQDDSASADETYYAPCSASSHSSSIGEELSHLLSDESDEEADPRTLSKQISSRTYEWSRTAKPPVAYSRMKGDTQSHMTNFDENELDPFQIFSKFFTESFIQTLVTFTNQKSKADSTEVNLTNEELKAVFGMLIIMGFHRLPSHYHYWSDNPNFGVPRINSIMSCGRFRQIVKLLVFHDPKSPQKNDENGEFMVNPLVEHFNEKFAHHRSPNGWLSIDTSQLGSKSIIQRNEDRSLKITTLCCAKTGYLFQMRSEFSPSNCNEIALSLLSPYENSGQAVVLGNRYSNFILAEQLYEKKIFVCTQLLANDPNIPSSLKTSNSTTEEGDFVQSGDFSITKWKSRKKYCYIFSTLHDPSKTKDILRTTKNKSNELIDCRESVLDFHNFCSGVKLFDQLRLTYSTAWKTMGWTRRFIYFFLDAALVNSYIIYKDAWQQMKSDDATEKIMKPLGFRSEIADKLIRTFKTRKRARVSTKVVKKLKQGGVHVIDDTTMHLPVQCTRRRCAHCSTRNKQKRSTIFCSDCQVSLCLTCYAPFHTSE